MSKQNTSLESRAAAHARPEGSRLESENRRIAAMTPAEREAEFADPYNIPDEQFWASCTLEPGPTKVEIHIRLDTEVVDWFKARGRGYQSRINAVLRSYVKAQILESAPHHRAEKG